MSRNSKILKKLLVNRPHKIGAEVGVFEGDTSKALLEALPGIERLVCVDLWTEDIEFLRHTPNKKGRIYNANWGKVRQTFMEQVVDVYESRVMPLQMKSIHAAELFPKEVFDFVFIDGNHGYPFVKEDIEHWYPNVKLGGLICGDDYKDKPTHGVIRAVDELLPKREVMGPIWYMTKITKEL